MTTEQQLPSVEQSLDHVESNVLHRAFWHKLAQCGFPAQNEQEALDQLALGYKLAAAAAEQGETPAPGGSKYAEALGALDGITKQGQASDALAVAQQMAHDPLTYQTTLVLKHAQAQEAAGEAAQDGEQQAEPAAA